jgi:hypothetical protein
MFEDDPQLAAFAQDLRAAADAIPAPAVRDDLAAVLAGTAPAPVPAWIPRRRRSRRSVTLRATIAGAAFGLGIGSLGVAGALPDPVQRQLSHAGDVVGVHLPTPADDHTSQGREEEQQQAPGIRVVRPTTPAAQHNAGNDEQDTPGTADNDGEHRGSTDDPNERGDEQRNEHATTTTTVGDDHRGSDEGKGDENSGGARVKNITTSTTIDHHGDNDDTTSSDDVDGSSGSNSQLSR